MQKIEHKDVKGEPGPEEDIVKVRDRKREATRGRQTISKRS
jgi:hypothetical protein